MIFDKSIHYMPVKRINFILKKEFLFIMNTAVFLLFCFDMQRL